MYGVVQSINTDASALGVTSQEMEHLVMCSAIEMKTVWNFWQKEKTLATNARWLHFAILFSMAQFKLIDLLFLWQWTADLAA